MAIEFFLKGVILGLSIAAPLGPIGILCIRRTLTYGKYTGIVSGLGAASADAVYGFIASIGLTFVTSLIINQQHWFQLIGAIFLGYLGIRIFTSKNSYETSTTMKNQHMKAFSTTFILTLTNPMTILSFAAIFSGLGIANTTIALTPKVLLVVGVFLGSSLWWIFLSLIVSSIKNQITGFTFVINKLSGVILLAFSLWSFYEVLK